MVICVPDSVADRADPPTRQAIESARRQQLQYVQDLRRKLAANNWAGRIGAIRPLGQSFTAQT